MIWWQKLLNVVYREHLFFDDGSRVQFFPRRDALRYLVPPHPSDFWVRSPRASAWIPLSYESHSKRLRVLIDETAGWEIPAGKPMSEADLDDIRAKLRSYVASTRGRFVLVEKNDPISVVEA